MAIPLYVMCSRGVATDKESGLYSVFEIIEKLVLTEIPKPKGPDEALIIERQPFIITTSWLIDQKSGETYDDDFELHVKVYMEHGDTVMESTQGFKFLGPETPAHRFTIRLMGPMPVTQSGIMIVECRARKVGSPSWKQHQFRVVVEKQRIDPASS